ncbi:hypothetical protein ACR79T_05890 [Sphingobacterium spiritivorum]|uniref:hypothetical protein n=1 Tax=Sphingobacterium spiritivorum TaxID=258 RepID=UPI003DA25CB7
MKSSFSTQDCCNTVGLFNEANISYPKPVLHNQHYNLSPESYDPFEWNNHN